MIEVRGLTKLYGDTQAIKNLNFTIQRGEIAGFLGLNGAGKSTALKILAGFLLPTAGQVLIDGVNLVSEPEGFRQQIGFLPEVPPLYEEMTVRDYLLYVARLRGLSKARAKERLGVVAEETGLRGRIDDPIGSLSLGYRKRLGIAQAIIHEPALVILDEPISGLDPVQIVQMRDLIRRLGGQHTVLISSHILPEVQETCDRLLVLRDGELVAQGTEADLLAQTHASRELEALLVGDTSIIESTLRACADVETFKMQRQLAGDLSLWRITLANEAAEGMVAQLVGAGVGMRRLRQLDHDLEAAFMGLTSPGEKK